MIKLILACILLPIIIVGMVVLFTPWLDETIVNNIPRPQDPIERNYVISDVKFEGGDTDVTLAGELTMPSSGGPFPAIIMITGSGPQDRNEQIMGHRPFLVFSDYMTKRGYAVLRYDDRGFAKSTGNHGTATTNDFANDAAAAFRWLQNHDKIDPLKIGFAGHSEGGYIAPLAAKQVKPNFMVLLMGPAQSFADTAVEQSVDMARADGKSEAEIVRVKAAIKKIINHAMTAADLDEIRETITPIINANADVFPDWFVEIGSDHMSRDWMVWLLNYDPIPALMSFDGPVFAVYGGKDTQVSAKTNMPIMEATLTHESSETIVFPKINHMFQPAKTGALEEYVWSDTTFDETMLATIGDWLDITVAARDAR